MNHETLNQRVDALMTDAISFAIAYYDVPPSNDHKLPPFPESNNFPDPLSCIDFSEYLPQKLDLQNNFTDDVNTEAMLPHSKRQKMESGCDVSLVKDASYDQPTDEMVPSKGLEAAGQISVGIDSMPTLKKVIIIDDDDAEEEGTNAQKITRENVIIIDDDEEEGTDAQKISEESDIDIGAVPIDVEDKQDSIEFNQEGTDSQKKISEPKADQEKQTNDVVSLIDLFTYDQITEHIRSLKKGSVQVSTPPSRVLNYIDLFRHCCYEPIMSIIALLDFF